MNRWRYEYDCRGCTNKETVNGAEYCIPLRALRHPTHADDDFVCRCDEYRPGQISMEGFV